MRCICDRSALLEALTATSAVTPARTTKPVLECVRLTVEADMLTVTAYDQEVGLRCRVRQVEVQQPGELLVKGSRLLAIVRESADETMAFEVADGMLHIRGADSHFQVVGQDVQEFPPVPDLQGEPTLAVQVGPLRDAVEKTLFAAARENTRYAINGVLWEQKAKRLHLVATDGRRLARSWAPLERASDSGDLRAIVPTKALGLLARLHLGADEMLEMRWEPNQVVMRAERATISTVLVEGHFPKYEDVIPRDHDKAVTVPTSELLSAVRRAALLASIESKGIRLKLEPGSLVLSGRSPEQGEATVELRVDYSGAGVVMGFNPEFLADALRVCGESTTLELKEASKPAVLRSGSNFEYVVMPVNLS